MNSSPFCCKDARGPDLRIGRTWIQVCFKISHRVFVNFVVPLLARFWKPVYCYATALPPRSVVKTREEGRAGTEVVQRYATAVRGPRSAVVR